MRNLRHLSMIITFFACLCLPLGTNAASSTPSEKTPMSAEKNLKDQKAAASEKNETKAASASKDKKNSPQVVADKSKSGVNEDKEVWMKRARESEILTGKASWYGRDFHNKKTASGVSYDMYTFTAAHRTLPLGTVVKVTDQHNGKSVMVCITDRGPYVQGRIIDLSYAAAKKLDLEDRGVGRVAVEVVSDSEGSPLKSGNAYYVTYNTDNGKKRVGPYNVYADAAAMHEAIQQAHPEAELVMESSSK